MSIARLGFPLREHIGAECDGDAQCGERHACVGSQCTCSPALTACPDDCWALSNDRDHCGYCGRRCPAGQDCFEGRCLSPESGGDARADRIRYIRSTRNGPVLDPPVIVDGADGGSTPLGPLTPTHTDFRVSGGTGTCYSSSGDEAVVDQGSDGGIDGGGPNGAVVDFNSANGAGLYNWANPENTWGSSQLALAVQSGRKNRGDPGVTHSDYTGMVYISDILSPSDGGPGMCLGIGAADWYHVKHNNWNNSPHSYPLTCIGPTVNADVTSIYYDNEGKNLWAASGGDNVFYLMKNCTGQPGGSTCPVYGGGGIQIHSPDGGVADAGGNTGGIYSHATVDANPCSHNGLLAYRAIDPNGNYHTIVIESRSKTDGSLIRQNQIDTEPFAQNPGCSNGGKLSKFNFNKCGGNTENCALDGGATCDCADKVKFDRTGCLRSNLRVQMATQMASDGTCYLYVGYDTVCTLLGPAIFKSKMRVYKIDQFDNISLQITHLSSACGTSDNDYDTMVAASKFNNSVGYFFTRAPSNGTTTFDSCSTNVYGFTDTNHALGSTMAATGNLVGSSWPAIRDSVSDGMGDYHGAAKKGTPDGLLLVFGHGFPTTPNSCIPCNGGQWGVDVFGALVVP
jgi:hypothetical protein